MIIKPTELCVIRRTTIMVYREHSLYSQLDPLSCLAVYIYMALVGNGLAGQTIHRASMHRMHGVLACNACMYSSLM